MIDLPDYLSTNFRPALTEEILSWSFGAINAPRPTSSNWGKKRNTLDDQAIFGPLNDFQCACGKGKFENLGLNIWPICAQCGTKMGPRSLRNQRFAHINLWTSIPHPFSDTILIDAFPVLPPRFWESNAGGNLAAIYDAIAEFNHYGEKGIYEPITRAVLLILPVLITAEKWNLIDSNTLARGAALVPRGIFEQGGTNAGIRQPGTGIDP